MVDDDDMSEREADVFERLRAAQKAEIGGLLAALNKAEVALRREFYEVEGKPPRKDERRQIIDAVRRAAAFVKRVGSDE